MKNKFKKFCATVEDCWDFIFKEPALNHLRNSRANPGRFASYSQLKRYQKRFRKVVLRFFFAVIFIFIGALFGPVLFKDKFQSEIYIPDGRADILIGNISKNQATVIFKTFDAKNYNKPLATSAQIEIYLDPDLKTLLKKTEPSEYAVTHIIPLYGLQEGKYYYLRVLASESSGMENAKNVSRWGGKEPIQLYTAGENIPACSVAQSVKDIVVQQEDGKKMESGEDVYAGATIAPSSDVSQSFVAPVVESLKISSVQNENYLHGKRKIQTIVSWETNNISDSTLVIRSENEDKETVTRREGEYGKKHAVILTTLKPQTTYYFKVKSRVQATGEEAVSNEYSMRTPRPKETVFEMLENNFKSLF